MTPKEKAEDLFYKFFKYQYPRINLFGTSEQRAKECALIAVDEMLKSMAIQQCNEDEYWKEVKNEIERL